MIIGQDEIKSLLEVACEDNLPALLVGETGTGKTSMVRELAENHKKTYSRFSITGETTVDDFVGKYILKNGETVWQDGALLTAAKKGHYLVVDEINAALPEILFVLHSLLDDDKYIMVPQKDNSIIRPHKDFRFFATMNPVDEYAGTKELNKAFHSRFAMVLEVKYPDRQTEVQILTENTSVKKDMAQKMVDVAVGVRQAKQAEKLFYTLSTRDLIYWGKLTEKLGIHRAFRVSIKNKGGEDGPTIETIYTKVFSDYKKAEENKLVMNIEFYQEENKKLERSKARINQEAMQEIQKEKAVIKEMEKRVKKMIADNLKKVKGDLNTNKSSLKSRMEDKAVQAAAFNRDANGKFAKKVTKAEDIDINDLPF